METERVEKVWVVRECGKVAPAVTIPAEGKTRNDAITEAIVELDREIHRTYTVDELECTFRAVTLGPIVTTHGKDKNKFDKR